MLRRGVTALYSWTESRARRSLRARVCVCVCARMSAKPEDERYSLYARAAIDECER
jgi:hypothetical protein